MIVLLDVGNTRVKLGWQHAELGREPVSPALTLHPPETLIASVRAWLAEVPVQPLAAQGVNVAGTAVARLIEDTFSEVGCPIQWLVPTAEALGVRNGYSQPGQLGADRWAALLGLAQQAQPFAQDDDNRHRPFVLATFGTATTIDTLGPDQVFEGGLILPGPALMCQSLAHGTANLPMASGPGNNFPKNTLQAISTGMVAAQAGAVWRQCQIAENYYGLAPVLFVSGGGWPEVEAEVRRILSQLKIQFLTNPVLDGLARLARCPRHG